MCLQLEQRLQISSFPTKFSGPTENESDLNCQRKTVSFHRFVVSVPLACTLTSTVLSLVFHFRWNAPFLVAWKHLVSGTGPGCALRC